MNKTIIFTIGILIGQISLYGQNWKVHINTNEVFILGNKLKGQYPALWHKKENGFMAGGFGVGVSTTQLFKEKYIIKYQVNVIRQRYFDEPYLNSDYSGAQLFGSLGINTNYNIITNATINNSLGLNDKWLFGIGLGLRTNILSHSDYGKVDINGIPTELTFPNLSTSKIVLNLPLEASYNFKKFTFSLRSELDITRSSTLKIFKSERFFVLNFEVGYLFSELKTRKL